MPFTHSLTPPPLHGFRGDATPPPPGRPRGLTVAVSRESGARGNSIARRVGRLLGWQVFDQEALGYLTQDEAARREALADLPADARAWADALANDLLRTRPAVTPELAEFVRLVFALAARGEVVLVGRGGGAVLPADSTLNVRVIAPPAERVAYMSQWLRLPVSEAAAEVAARDRVRAELHQALTDRDPADLTQYDLVLNSGRLGDAATADLIAAAVKAKHLPDVASDDYPSEPV